MAVRYKDYYKVLGVKRDDSPEKIRKRYRSLAKRYHPDATQGDKAKEEKFKEISEAYDVLGDPEKRSRYDSLGANWKHGANFTPPPGWENIIFNFSGGKGGARTFTFGEDASGGFSDFFDALFGGLGGRFGGADDPLSRTCGRPSAHRQSFARKGEDVRADMTITLREAFRGGRHSITLQRQEVCASCGGRGSIRQAGKPALHGAGCSPCGGSGMTVRTQRFDVDIPRGVKEGTTIRLAGQGGAGTGGGPVGDLYITMHFAPDPVFKVSGYDVSVEVPVAPWEAALGAKVAVSTLRGSATLSIPPGVQSGQKLRLKGQGLPGKRGGRGDEYAVMKIVVPKKLSKEERRLFEEMARKSTFRPRG